MAATSLLGVKQFNLSPEQDRVSAAVDPAAAALVPESGKYEAVMSNVTVTEDGSYARILDRWASPPRPCKSPS